MDSVARFFFELIQKNKSGGDAAICSVCSSNPLVIAAAARHAAKTGNPLLVEATANQVNQFGGYTGMVPNDFIGFVEALSEKEGLPASQILFGGDHLGPLVWSNEPEASCMEKAEALVAAYAAAGFQKIHLDCSMRLGDDDPMLPLAPEKVAARTARLARVVEAARCPDTVPVYVVGSEVPIPGGATDHEDTLAVTRPSDMRRELELFREAFADAGLQDAWNRVIAIVVQPGVEFGDNQVFLYDHEEAKELADCAASYSRIAMEGHSTDYQPASCLSAMKRDGIAVLKVGPALTFAMRSALFALEGIERRAWPEPPAGGLSEFEQTLEQAMVEKPANWIRHYHGPEPTLALMRRFSLSDRCRYYMEVPSVRAAQRKLFENFDAAAVPLGLLAQFFPRQYEEVLAGRLVPTAENLVFRQIEYVLETYEC